MTEYDYTGSVVVVTGGSRGIGRQICESFARSGALVETVSRRALEESFSSPYISHQIVDIRNAEESQEYLAEVFTRRGRIDILVNNAGGSPLVPSECASPGFTRKIIELNLVAPLVLSQQAYPYLCRQAGASIINISSISDIRPSPGSSAYGAAKAGIINASRSLAQEWGPTIRVNSVIAGMVETELTGEHYGESNKRASVCSSIGMKRFGCPDDIAKACLYLASDDASYVSGAALEVHGGGEIALSVQSP